MPVIDIDTDRPTCDEDVIANLSLENLELHNALFRLFQIIKCLVISEKDLRIAGVDLEYYKKAMNTAQKLLKEENRN